MFNVKNKLIIGEKTYSLGSYLIGNIEFQFEDATFIGTDVFELKIGGNTIPTNYGFFKSGKITFTGINFTDLIGENKAIVVEKNGTEILNDTITINSSLQMVETDPFFTSASVDLATKTYVGSAVSSATAGLASETFVGNAVSSATAGLASEGFVTSAITAATSGLATETYVGQAVSSGISGLASEAYVTSAITSSIGDINAVLDNIIGSSSSAN